MAAPSDALAAAGLVTPPPKGSPRASAPAPPPRASAMGGASSPPGGSDMKRSKTVAMLGVGEEAKEEMDHLMFSTALFVPPKLDETEAFNFELTEIYDMHLNQSAVSGAMSPRSVESAKSVSMRASSAAVSTSGPEGEEDEKSSGVSRERPGFYQLVFDIQHCIFKAGNDSICLFSLYDHGTQEYISEEYALHLTPFAFPTVGLIDECKVLFRDLTEEMLKKDLYIVCKIYRVGPMDAPDVTKTGDDKKSSGIFGGKRKSDELKITRPFAATVMPLRASFPALKASEGTAIDFDPNSAPVMCPSNELFFHTLPYDLIEGTAKPPPTIAPMSLGIAYSLTMFKGTSDSLKDRYPAFEHLTFIDQLAVNPLSDTPRNRLYMSLLDMHVQQRRKKSPCNVKVVVELRDASYQAVAGVHLGCGPMASPATNFSSPVYYHTNDPVYNQNLVIEIPEELKNLENMHMYFSLYHQPAHAAKEEERGFAFMPLLVGSPGSYSLRPSKKYTLEVYRNDKKAVSYLTNQSMLVSDQKSINVFFRVASTRVLPDADVFKFVTFKHQKPVTLVQCVQRMARKSFEEMMTILDEFMMVCFTLMAQTKDTSLLEEVFFVLMSVLGEVNNTINVRFKSRVEEWIRERFKYPNIWRILGQQQLNLLNWIASESAIQAEKKGAEVALVKQAATIVRHLTKTMRGVEYLFQLMKRSMELEMHENPSGKKVIASEYATMTRQLFDAMNKLMTLEKPKTVNGVQSYALRGFVSLLDGLTTKDSKVLINLAIKFLKSSNTKGGVHNSVEKLLLIKRLVEHPRLNRADTVTTLLPAVCPMILRYLKRAQPEYMDEPLACTLIVKSCIPLLCPGKPRIVSVDGDPTKTCLMPDDGKLKTVPPALMDQFTLILLRMFSVMNITRRIDLTEVTNAARIFNTTLSKNPHRDRSMSVPGVRDMSKEQVFVLRDFVITITELSRVLTNTTGKSETFILNSDRIDNVLTKLRGGNEAQKEECPQLIANVLTCAGNMLRKSLFPPGWVFMRMIEAEIGMRALSWFGSTLKKSYLGSRFDRQLWADWLILGMSFLSNRDFALEDMEEARADLIRDNYGDIRQMAIRKLTAAWEELTPHREHLADIMVRSAVEASASNVPEIQEFAVEVYFQMMKSEFNLRGHLKTVETHTIDQVDHLTAAYSNEPKIIDRYLDFFRVRVINQLKSSSKKLKDEGHKFISEIEKLYDYLVQLRKLPSDRTHEDERTAATLELLEYLKRIGKDTMYNRYLHHLALMHKELQNYTEAGICLREHAGRLGYSKTLLRYEAQVELEEELEWKRHIKLLDRAREYFMLGSSWEMGVRICQTMAEIYEHKLYQIDKLPSILQKESQMWTCILNQSRVFPSCYFVQFRGAGFKDDRVRGMGFIFKSGNGKHPEGIRDFTERIRNKYAGAEVVNSPNPIPTDKEAGDFAGKYIQITTLQASSQEEMAGGDFKWDNTDAPLTLRQYYRENETSVFTYTFQDRSKRVKGENEFRSVWIVRHYVVAQDSIPCRSRRVPVARVVRKEYTPLETAVDSLADKTKQLLSLVEAVESDPKHNPNTLSMCLNGILDAAVMGGVDKYREAFFDGTYMAALPEDRFREEDFKNALREQMDAAEIGLRCYSKYASEDLGAHVTHLQDCLTRMRRDLYEFLGKKKRGAA